MHHPDPDRCPLVRDHRYGDGFFVNNLFVSHAYFKEYVDFYQQRCEHHRAEGRHHGPAGGIVGAGGATYVRPRSQDAWEEFRPVYEGHPILSSSGASRPRSPQLV
jgi:hypothetical protein